MDNKQAADILRTIAQQNLPTVNGLPFPEIREALVLGAEALDPTPVRNCEGCEHRTTTRTNRGTVRACSVWECDYKPFKKGGDA